MLEFYTKVGGSYFSKKQIEYKCVLFVIDKKESLINYDNKKELINFDSLCRDELENYERKYGK